MKRLTEQGRALEVKVEDIKQPLYMRAEDRNTLETVMESEAPPSRAAVLAPLDNLLWERELVKHLFDFDYTWEVYKPVAERRYGYYVLPVLCGDRFIARFEPARNKKTGDLIIKNWWWEPGIEPSGEMRAALRDCFERFKGYLGTDTIKVERKLVKRERLDWLPVR